MSPRESTQLPWPGPRQSKRASTFPEASRTLTRACLKGRTPDETALQRAINAYEAQRNSAKAVINWRFSTHDARTKLHRLYPFNSKID